MPYEGRPLPVFAPSCVAAGSDSQTSGDPGESDPRGHAEAVLMKPITRFTSCL